MSEQFKIDLAGTWRLYSADSSPVAAELPGDNYSALLAAGKIPDPYYGCNEKIVQHECDRLWTFEREFEVDSGFLARKSVFLNLDSIDTFGEVFINGVSVGSSANMFVRFRREVRELLRPGRNTLTVAIRPPGPEALAAAERQPLALRYMYFCSVPHINLIRKVQCHSGWDWGISLVVCGLYGGLYLEADDGCRIEHLYSEQRHEAGRVVLTAFAELAGDAGSVEFRFNGETRIASGAGRVSVEFVLESPRLWYPNGVGAQPLYELSATVGWHTVRRKIGLRTVEVVSEPDAEGRSMYFKVNGIPVFAKGADWIPCDALPCRMTREVYDRLTGDAAAVGMNMLRVWGGGQYENEEFYDLCDERGIMLWHDLMFACAEYPSTPEFLDLVAPEVEYQVKRLRDHASIMLWCGDNEVPGLMRGEGMELVRHAVNYDRLNRALKSWVHGADPTRVFWPSSPCCGPDDGFGDWHDDSRGDMHYWKVWHKGEPFEAYYTVRPRFCSEFGFQSFPALSTVRSFGGRNVTDPVMECHQKNRAGNAKIIGMFARYFRFPSGLEEFVYLSQVQQTLAIRTAVEFWRTLRPHCMGTLYWQLNDNWPVASWSSIDYYGNWKLLHYAAKRFYAPLLVTARREEDGSVGFYAANDARREFSGGLTIEHYSFAGEVLSRCEIPVTVAPESATRLEVPTVAASGDGFLHYRLGDAEGEFFFAAFKDLDLPEAEIKLVELGDGSFEISADRPAFFVALESETPTVWSDNGFTLLPGRPRVISKIRGGGEKPRIMQLGMIR
jgi:beta-mannosidase